MTDEQQKRDWPICPVCHWAILKIIIIKDFDRNWLKCNICGFMKETK